MLALLGTMSACGAAVPSLARCERGGYLDSVSTCQRLAAESTEWSQQAHYNALAARAQMWSCHEIASEACSAALDGLWRWSTDLLEVTTAVELSQQACQAGNAGGCQRASGAAWFGRGVAIDAVASLSWHQQCPSCGEWSSESADPRLTVGWAEVDGATRLARIAALAGAGALAQATAVLDHELSAGLLAGHEAEAGELLARTVTARWAAEVEPLVAAGEAIRALAVAEQLVALSPQDPALAGGRDRIRAALAADEVAFSQAAAARGLPLAAAFHAVRALQLGGVVTVAPVDVAALWVDLPTRPRFTLPASCEWIRAALEGSYPATSANVTITATLTCQAEERNWSEVQAYVWYEAVERTETRQVPGQTVVNHQTCNRTSAPVCQSYDNGQQFCSSHNETYDCSTTTTGPSTTETYTVVDQIPHDGSREVARRAVNVSIAGTVDSPTARGQTSYQRVLDETQFSDTHGSQAFTAATLAELRGEATAAVIATVEQLIAAARGAQASLELEAAERAGEPLLAEEHRLRAFTLGDPGSALAAAYRMTEAQLAELMSTGRLGLPEVIAPRFAATAPTLATGGLPLSHFPGQPSGDYEDARQSSKARRGTLYRLVNGTELTLESGTRTGGGLESSGLGARLERGWKLDRPYGLAFGGSLAGGSDGTHGSWYDARLAVAVGVRSENHQLVYVIGLGAGGLGVRGTGAMAELTSAVDFFHGADLRLGAGPIALEGRLWQVRGGPLGREVRAAAQLLVQLGPFVLGGEASIRGFDNLGGDQITGLGLVFGVRADRRR